MIEKFYIEITYNEKMVLGTFLFNSEAEAVSWWEKVSTIDELVNAISWDIYANGPDDSSAFSFDSIGLIKGKSKKIKNCC